MRSRAHGIDHQITSSTHHEVGPRPRGHGSERTSLAWASSVRGFWGPYRVSKVAPLSSSSGRAASRWPCIASTSPSQAAKVVVDDRGELVERALVAVAPPQQRAV